MNYINKIFGKKRCSCCGSKNNISKKGLCTNCISRPACDKCKKVKLGSWIHSCGTFCKDCMDKIFVDVSYGNVKIIRRIAMCRKCIGNKNIHQISSEFSEK